MTILEGAMFLLLGLLLNAVGAWTLRAAKRGGKAINVIGGSMTLMTLGNVQDPGNEIIQTAQEPRKKISGDNGDPPDDKKLVGGRMSPRNPMQRTGMDKVPGR